MKTQPNVTPLPPCIEAIKWGAIVYCIERAVDYTDAALPADLRAFFATRVVNTSDPDAALRAEFEQAEQQAKEAEFAKFKARAGEKPTFDAYQAKLLADEEAAYAAFKAAVPKAAPPTLWQTTVAKTKSMLRLNKQ